MVNWAIQLDILNSLLSLHLLDPWKNKAISEWAAKEEIRKVIGHLSHTLFWILVN